MAILNIKQKIEPYVKNATGYIKLLLSSKHVVMEDGKDLETTITNLNSEIDYKLIKESWTNPTYSVIKKNGIVYMDYQCVVKNGVKGHEYEVGTLPTECYPKHLIRAAAWVADAAGTRFAASVAFETDGMIKLVAENAFYEAGFLVSYLN